MTYPNKDYPEKQKDLAVVDDHNKNMTLFELHKFVEALVNTFRGTPRTYYSVDLDIAPTGTSSRSVSYDIDDDNRVVKIYNKQD